MIRYISRTLGMKLISVLFWLTDMTKASRERPLRVLASRA